MHVPLVFKYFMDWIDKDCDIQTTITPHNIVQSDIDYATCLLSGGINHKLPVVYVSSTYGDTHAINPTKLAEKLFGISHVFVEPNRAFANRLRLNLDNTNPHNGAIGIFWGGDSYFDLMFRSDDDHDIFIEKIARKIINGLKVYQLSNTTRWEGLEQKIIKSQLEKLKQDKNSSVDEYMDAFDKENASLRKDIDQLTANNQYLKEELKRKSREIAAQGVCFSVGNCIENYTDEIAFLILEILKKEQTQLEMKTRKRDIIDNIISNNTVIDASEKIKNTLKQILIEAKTEQYKARFEELGLELEDAGKHSKLHWRGIDNYYATVPKTPSDYRGQLNLFSDIKKTLF